METVISRGSDTALLKGFAIIAIVVHNFCHWIPGCVAENEYNFQISNTLHLWDVLRNGGPHVVLNLFSYFGCYGVAVFLFLSGYGVAKKYESQYPPQGDAPIGVWRFTRYNALKLWRLMAVGLITLLAYEAIFTASGWRHGVMNVVWWFAFLQNFFPQFATTLLPRQDLLLGPWWYFSLTMQMYLLYRLALYKRGKGALIAWATISIMVQGAAVTVFNDPTQTMLHYVRYIFPGCLLPFALGVWTARYGLNISKWLWATAAVVFVLACVNVAAWIIAPLAVVVMAMPVIKLRAGTLFRRAIEEIGKLSAALFVIHPVVRCFINPRFGGNVYLQLAEYLAISMAAAWVITKLLSILPHPKL